MTMRGEIIAAGFPFVGVTETKPHTRKLKVSATILFNLERQYSFWRCLVLRSCGDQIPAASQLEPWLLDISILNIGI